MDLNVIIEQDRVRDSIGVVRSKLQRCLKLGYKAIALSVHIEGNQVGNIPNPLQLTPESLKFFDATKMEIHSRLTVAVDEGLQLHKLGQSPIAKKYDLLALQPMNDKVFNQILTGNLDCDIITFDFSERSPLSFRKAKFSVPKERDIVMEINYAQALQSSSSRHNVFAYGQNLVRKTRGKSILLSSGARNAMALRAPNSVTSLGLLFELPENLSRDSVYLNCLKALRHSRVRKEPALSAVSCEPLKENEKWVRKELLAAGDEKSSSQDMACSSPKRIKMDSVG
ncbi:ribonuclease P protein subunit Rpp30 [Brevipalpus obovatus]|uniref:ribonuclease P protein subunit Rpp30 n=1 Tax=Brevipalpus obovatus TaxID=246614 RepID=UPI003D9DCB26